MTFSELMKNEFGYETKTTYWEDFSIAERFGLKAIKDTFKSAMLNTSCEMITELCLVLNHKIWYWYEKNETIAKLYDTLWRECDNWCCENLKGEELNYFLRTTD